jgi:hypothetical protein
VDATPTNEYLVHRPGSVSAFFVYKSVFMAGCAWIWVAVLAITTDKVTGWSVFAATSAVTFSLVGLALWIRYAAQRNSAARHEQIMKTLVDLSWQTFAREMPVDPPTRGSSAREAAGQNGFSHDLDGDTSVIRLAPEARHRPRR